jgi:hypothetical protein
MHITGILLPSDWDDSGTVTEVILATADEGELLVECSDPASEFNRFLRKEVVVNGELRQRAAKRVLAIHAIRLSSRDSHLMEVETDT